MRGDLGLGEVRKGGGGGEGEAEGEKRQVR